ncbi:hypothetical protein AC249_AIPGENE24641 [Exaiptasia diaphana]|nr:hypothetical protein AC249_AIPGENE24641 [Exaiptasia diaphana]
MGAQKTEKAINRASRAAAGLKHIVENFDDCTGIHPESTVHTYKDAESDIMDMINIINREKILNSIPGRAHPTFADLPKSLLDTLDIAKMEKWMKSWKRKLAKNPDVPGDDNPDDDESQVEESEDDQDDSDGYSNSD